MKNEINDRIKKVRNILGLSISAFARDVNMSQSILSLYESGKRPPSNMAIGLICKTYHVNEQWLGTGEGDIFSVNEKTEEELIAAKFVSAIENEKDPLKRKLLKLIMKMSPGDWEALERIIQKLQEIEALERQ